MPKRRIPPKGPLPRRRVRRAKTKATRKTATRKPIPTAHPLPTDGHAVVRLRIDGGATGVVAEVGESAHLVRVAATWMYILRNRSRWAGEEAVRGIMRERAFEDLERIGVPEEAIERIAHSSSHHVEVEVVDRSATRRDVTDVEDAAASFPWEFVLSAATRHRGRVEPLLVTRLLERHVAALPPLTTSTKLFVESAPGRLADAYSFDTERARLNAATGAHESGSGRRHSPWRVSRSETPSGLRKRIADLQPDIIHVSGVDNHQVSRLIPGFYEEEAIRNITDGVPEDGAVMCGTPTPEVPIPSYELASRLVNPTLRDGGPRLVTLNLCYSGARVARELVRAGAHAALGFMDEIEDDLAEAFFQALYGAWREDVNASPATALGRAWYFLKEHGRNLYGTGVALWLGRSVFAGASVPVSAPSDAAGDGTPEPRLPTKAERDSARLLPIGEVLQVDLDVPETLNYSLLHNSRPLFGVLTLSKLVDYPLDEVSVEVRLDIGDGSPQFRCTELLLDEPQRALADTVRLPLTAALLRSSRERLQSAIYVRVMWDGRVVFEQTKAVMLLPVDEWLDDTTNNPWLPSFVLPRDPAVTKIIAAARPHLIAVQDDPDAGFDGYQSVPEGDDVRPEDCDAVDQQVQAIWTALVHEFRLAYINPPPAYAATNQRLRTPSEILGTRSGTCIDLALLLASCLEYVDIYPVVVLLSGHAFVGYWRSEQYHTQLCQLADIPRKSLGLEVGRLSAHSPVPLTDAFGWRLAPQQYHEIMEYHRTDRIRFLEATGLCFNYSYAEAVKEGRGNMKVPADFDSLLDVKLARDATPSVTPLPIFAGRET